MAARGFHVHYPRDGGEVDHDGPAESCRQPELGPVTDLAKDAMIHPVIERIVWTDSGAFIDKGWANLDVYQQQAREWNGRVEMPSTVRPT